MTKRTHTEPQWHLFLGYGTAIGDTFLSKWAFDASSTPDASRILELLRVFFADLVPSLYEKGVNQTNVIEIVLGYFSGTHPLLAEPSSSAPKFMKEDFKEQTTYVTPDMRAIANRGTWTAPPVYADEEEEEDGGPSSELNQFEAVTVTTFEMPEEI